MLPPGGSAPSHVHQVSFLALLSLISWGSGCTPPQGQQGLSRKSQHRKVRGSFLWAVRWESGSPGSGLHKSLDQSFIRHRITAWDISELRSSQRLNSHSSAILKGQALLYFSEMHRLPRCRVWQTLAARKSHLLRAPTPPPPTGSGGGAIRLKEVQRQA